MSAADSDTSTYRRRRRHRHRRGHKKIKERGEKADEEGDGFRDALGSDNEHDKNNGNEGEDEDEECATTTTTTTTSETETESVSLLNGGKGRARETQKSKKLVLSTLSLLVSMLSEHSTAEEMSDAVQHQLRQTVGTLNAVETLTSCGGGGASPLVAPRKLVRPVVASSSSARSARFSGATGGGIGGVAPSNSDLRGSNELRKTALFNASPRRAATPSPSSSPRADGKETTSNSNAASTKEASTTLPLFVSSTIAAKRRPSAANTPRVVSPTGSPRSPRTPVDSLLESPRRFILYASPRRVNLSTVPIESPRLIGDGGSARVYEVRIRPGFLLAAKVYHQFFLPGDDRDVERRRMQRKLDALYALPDHPNVLPVLGYRFEDNRLIVLMERMDCSLRSIIDKKREERKKDEKRNNNVDDDGEEEKRQTVVAEPLFSAKEVLGLWRQVVNGVAFLHHLPAPVDVVSGGKVVGLWPRDIKSENVMCSRVDCEWQNVVAEKAASSAKALGAHKEWHLRLADFDEAHIVYDDANPCSPIDWIEATQSTLQAIQTTLAASSTSSSTSSALEHSVSSPHPSSSSSTSSTNVVAAAPSTGATVAANAAPPSAGGKMFPKISSMPSMSQFFASNSSLRSSGNVAREEEAAPPVSSSTSGSMTSGRRKGRNSIERLSRNVGTLQFMSPEMVNSETLVYDERVDVWSLGMVLFELLTGGLPYGFDNYNSFELYDVVQKGVRPSLPQGYLQRETKASASEKVIWNDILRLFYDCTYLEVAKRPTAAILLERIDLLVVEACK